MTSGTVFDIKHFALHDGPGIRTTVFLKGCPLRCAWCHNPESQSARPEILFNAGRCAACGRCAAVCPAQAHTVAEGRHVFDRSRCAGCGACARACPAATPGVTVLELAGRTRTAGEVLTDVLKDREFYRQSGGGLTLSGGEPLAQAEFAAELARGAKEAGVGVCVETCGEGPETALAALRPWVDTFYFDIKALNPEKHRRLTGVDNARILRNLRAIAADGADIVFRCPLVPGLNDSDEDLRAIAALAASLPAVREIQIEPYHPLGMDKYARLGRTPEVNLPEFVSPEQTAAWLATLAAAGATPVSRA